ncbi:MAG: C69 family dipeptidase, partial [Erysipelotrichaceae bacterium]|nr:C69 family dipeptidase [Erysipelotrichaceae bacterium]
NVGKMPKYLSEVGMDVSSENFYWASRLIGALADPHYGHSIQHIERYQDAVASKGHQLINEYDRRMMESGSFDLMEEANEKLADMAKKESTKTLNKVLRVASEHMKISYSRADK